MSAIYSMTGYAVATRELPSGTLTTEIRAVNHRYLDIQFRLPEELRAIERPPAKRGDRPRQQLAEARPLTIPIRVIRGQASVEFTLRPVPHLLNPVPAR